jgi:hypothetical protein
MSVKVILRTVAVLSCVVTVALADTKIKAKYISDDHVTESATYTKGERQRIEYGRETVVLNQADLQKTIQLNTRSKTYLTITPDATPPKQGGVVTMTTSIVDTGERKQILGHAARRLKTTIDKQPSPGACDSKAERIETDGWYIDLDLPAASAAPELPCKDEIQTKHTGEEKLGYPVQYTMTASGTTFTMEVIELSTAPLDASLFEIPAGYSPEASVRKAGLRDPASKLANTTRIGLALQNKSGQSLNESALDDPIVAAMHDLVTEVVLLDAADVEASARKKECDYVLYTEITEMKKSTAGKVGGLLSRASGGGASKEIYDARLEYKLVKLGSSEPLLESSASGKSGGGFDMRGAMRLASTAGTLAMSMTSIRGSSR